MHPYNSGEGLKEREMGAIVTSRIESRFQIRSAPTGRKAISLLAIVDWIEARLERRRSRLALSEMTDEQLKDIGISRYDAHKEAHRPLWD
jgi:uncharacterized protein YjiS (DUF1127 family)